MNVVGIKSKELLEEYVKNNTKYELGKRYKMVGQPDNVGYEVYFENGLGLSIIRDTNVSIFSKGWWEILPLTKDKELYTDQGHLGNAVPGVVAKYINIISKLEKIEDFEGWDDGDDGNRYDL